MKYVYARAMFIGAVSSVCAWAAPAESGNQGENSGAIKNEVSSIAAYVRATGNIAEDSRVIIATVPKTKTSVAYLTGSHWCGSGGCTLLFLTSNAGKYKVVHKAIIVNLPVRYSVGTNGKPTSVSYWIRGGGVPKSYKVSVSIRGFKTSIVRSGKRIGAAELALIDLSSQSQPISQ